MNSEYNTIICKVSAAGVRIFSCLMQHSSSEDNRADPAANEKLPVSGGSSGKTSDEGHVTRYVSEVDCTCSPASDAGADDKDVTSVYDSWLSKLAADSTVAGSTDELTDGSGCMSLTEPSSSQVGSIVTVVSQNHVTGDCFSSECSADAACGLKDGVQNLHSKDKCMDARELESTVNPNSQSGCDVGAGKCLVVLPFHVSIILPSFEQFIADAMLRLT